MKPQILRQDKEKVVALWFVPGAETDNRYQVYKGGRMVISYANLGAAICEYNRVCSTAPTQVILGGGDGVMKGSE